MPESESFKVGREWVADQREPQRHLPRAEGMLVQKAEATRPSGKRGTLA